jgi:hypothetical protein
MVRILAVLIFFLPFFTYSQTFRSFGGVWVGSSNYTGGTMPTLNVGSFLLGQTNILGGLFHFGYAISANTNVVATSGAFTDDFGNLYQFSGVGVATHIPLEANVALVKEFGKFRGWIGGGTNASFVSGMVDIQMSAIIWGNYIYCSARATGKSEFTFGGQVFAGGEYVFGKVPYIGGIWGIFSQFKYMIIKDVNFKFTGTIECQDLTFGGTQTQDISETIRLDLDNTSFVLGLTYHF